MEGINKIKIWEGLAFYELYIKVHTVDIKI